ncbi:MAG: bifunctional phosphoribosylaminoimidazolecarboxamide formyltransferase/IMP cyclohydrolase [Actinomycetota bacterium]
MRALLSVYDKTGVVDLAKRLHELEVDLVSSGGTAAVIAEAGIPVTDVADITGFPAMLGHRVVTLHPRIHGGILADRRDTSHLRDLEAHNLDLIDLVVGNLYPFAKDPSIDLIDIGGPTLLRAAAKNHEYVTVLVDPADYDEVLGEIARGGTTPGLRFRLAKKAFAHTAAYDAAITEWFNDSTINAPSPLPDTINVSLERAEDLRYGENPHQVGARYRRAGRQSWWDSVVQHSGVGLSYLNIFDADAAWTMVHDLAVPFTGGGARAACVIVKHANPCGAAVAGDLATAYANAFACDERSAFGGIVACNRIVDLATVEAMEAAAQADLIIAPGYEHGAIDRLKAKRKNTRILTAPLPDAGGLAIRQLSDGYLVQSPHEFRSRPDAWEVVTDRQPTAEELADAELAWRVCGHVTSNAIVLAKDGVAWGIGAGQQNRVESGELAAQKADGRAKDGACASDAFFPFPDGIEAAAMAGVAVVIQPGGSVNDEAVIEAANRHGLAMIFTGERQFRH